MTLSKMNSSTVPGSCHIKSMDPTKTKSMNYAKTIISIRRHEDLTSVQQYLKLSPQLSGVESLDFQGHPMEIIKSLIRKRMNIVKKKL